MMEKVPVGSKSNSTVTDTPETTYCKLYGKILKRQRDAEKYCKANEQIINLKRSISLLWGRGTYGKNTQTSLLTRATER